MSTFATTDSHSYACAQCFFHAPCCCTTQACFSQCAMVHHPAGESICTDHTWFWYQATILHQQHVLRYYKLFTFASSSMKKRQFWPYARRQQKPSRYASNKGKKLEYQKGVTFLAHTVYAHGISTLQTDRQTDGRTDGWKTYGSNTSLCTTCIAR